LHQVSCTQVRADYRHRSQEAHECTAPRALHARQDAAAVRREKAAEVMAKHFPSQAGKERLRMPKQVDRTRTGSPPRPSTSSSPTASSAAPTAAPPPAEPAPAALTANDKLYKLHQTKTRSLARPLDPKVPREESAAIEFVVDESGAKVRTWLAADGKYAPTAVGTALGGGKPERLWVPHVMPGGKLFDTLVARGKLPRSGPVCLPSPLPCSHRLCAASSGSFILPSKERDEPLAVARPRAALTSAPRHPRHLASARCARRHRARPHAPRWRSGGYRRRPRPRARLGVRVYAYKAAT
jgi:hypothetical protein